MYIYLGGITYKTISLSKTSHQLLEIHTFPVTQMQAAKHRINLEQLSCHTNGPWLEPCLENNRQNPPACMLI